MIGLALKGTDSVPLATSLRAYLASKYTPTDVDSMTDSLSSLQTQRDAIASVRVANEGARTALSTYIAYLSALEAKVPAEALTVPFPWNDSLRPAAILAHPTVLYERCCVLFNLAACESQLATGVNRNSDEGRERARDHFCAGAAGSGGLTAAFFLT